MIIPLPENEATTKWCPFARVICTTNEWATAYNRSPEDYPRTKCIASQCMAWRQYKSAADAGYCGLAGE